MDLKQSYDIVVVGGGIAGIMAATKAAEKGEKVLLCEHYEFVGGMSTAGLVSPFMQHHIDGEKLVQGYFDELEKRMSSMGGMIDNGFYSWSFRSVASKLLHNNKVDIAYNSDLVEVDRVGDTITGITMQTPQGQRKIEANFFIDTSGDAQLVALGDFSWKKGDEKTGNLQALTTFFRMGGIDIPKVAEYAKTHQEEFLGWMDFNFDFSHILSIAGFTEHIKKGQEAGEISSDIEYIFFTSLPNSGEGSFNCTNILRIDPSSSKNLTLAEQEGNKQVHQLVDLMHNEVPGFDKSFLIETGVQVGVRETRRAIGEYLVNEKDISGGSKFPDAIARGCYGVDIHGQEDESSRLEELEEGTYYEIPYRSLLVKNSSNLLVAGRCISSTREGQSALRIMPTSAATGEACGAAASLASKLGCSLREMPYSSLKKEINYNL